MLSELSVNLFLKFTLKSAKMLSLLPLQPTVYFNTPVDMGGPCRYLQNGTQDTTEGVLKAQLFNNDFYYPISCYCCSLSLCLIVLKQLFIKSAFINYLSVIFFSN